MPVTAEGVLRWNGKLRFSGGAPGGPPIELDGDGEVAPSPVTALLVAGAACAAADVVIILEKMRIELAAIDVAMHAERRDATPRRLQKFHMVFTVKGAGLDQDKLSRAVSLSIEKYCSVLSSLADDIAVSYEARVG